MTIRISLLFYLIFLCNCCTAQSVEGQYNNFNEEARQTFLNRFESYDLNPLKSAERCILKKTIENDLDKNNNWKVSLIHNDFVVRSYYGGYLQLGYGFIKDKISSKYYFIWIPSLKECLYDLSVHYKEKNDSIYELQYPVKVIKLSAPLLDEFFKIPTFHVNPKKSDFFAKYNIARHLMKEVFEDIYKYEVSSGVFFGRMEYDLKTGVISDSTYDFINKKFNDPIATMENYQLETFYVKHAGYILFTYTRDPSTEFLRVDTYYIPNKERGVSVRWITAKYKDCLAIPD